MTGTADVFARLRSRHPLIIAVTNNVTVNDCANVLLAAGASPAMSEAAADAAELTAAAAALYLNIGTVNPTTREAMFAAAAVAAARQLPVVLDPVGAGASALRTDTARELLNTGAVTLLRGNVSEILALAGQKAHPHGVDSTAAVHPDSVWNAAETLAARYSLTVGVSGAEDFICGSGRREICRRGHPLMPLVTGSGCMLSALCAAVLAVESDPVTAALETFTMFGTCGETAAAGLLPGEGNAAFRTRLIDAVFNFQRSPVA